MIPDKSNDSFLPQAEKLKVECLIALCIYIDQFFPQFLFILRVLGKCFVGFNGWSTGH